MKTVLRLLAIWMGVLLFFSMFGVLLSTKSLEQEKQKETYTIGSQTIPSMVVVKGERNLGSIVYRGDTRTTVYAYNYINVNNIAADLSIYANYLIEKAGFSTNQTDLSFKGDYGTVVLSKDKLYVHLDWNKNESTYRVLLRLAK